MIRIFIFSLAVLMVTVSSPFAEEYNITNCWGGDVTLLHKGEELSILGFDVQGVSMANEGSTAFDGWSLQIIGTAKIENGKYSSTFYGIYKSPEGDVVIGEGNREGTEGKWEFIHGTGKWKGITGGGTVQSLVTAPPIQPGTTQSCVKAAGTFELPK